MNKNIIAGGCSFTRGNELSDDTLRKGKNPSNKTWAKGLSDLVQGNYFCTADGGIGNSAIARRVFEFVSNYDTHGVVVMWTFPSDMIGQCQGTTIWKTVVGHQSHLGTQAPNKTKY